MSVNEVYELMKYILNKNQNGYLAPDDFNRIINAAQRSYISYLLGTFQSYTPGRPIAKVELGQNSVVRQRLSPSIYNYNLTIDASGHSSYPGDYLQADAMWSFYGFNRIKWADQSKLHSYYNSVIDPISSNPIYLLEDSNFQFYPTNTAAARLSYVRNPPDIRWNYTLDVNGRPVYNPVGSVHPIFDDVGIMEVIVRALAMVGVNLQVGVVLQYAQEIKNTGQ